MVNQAGLVALRITRYSIHPQYLEIDKVTSILLYQVFNFIINEVSCTKKDNNMHDTLDIY